MYNTVTMALFYASTFAMGKRICDIYHLMNQTELIFDNAYNQKTVHICNFHSIPSTLSNLLTVKYTPEAVMCMLVLYQGLYFIVSLFNVCLSTCPLVNENLCNAKVLSKVLKRVSTSSKHM